MRISFCTTCANRFFQFEHTFEQNLAVISKHPDTEWIILNYNSKDALHPFMEQKIPSLPLRVVYAIETSSRDWHLSVAKNIAHCLGTGDVLMNLDCDNFIGSTVEMIEEEFSNDAQVLHQWSGKWGDGTCGRVAIGREIFHALGGYDESFNPMSFQDRDLLNRAKASGAIMRHRPCPPGSAIENSKEESIRNCPPTGLKWEDYLKLNKGKSEANIAAKRLVANAGIPWGKLQGKIIRGGN